MIMARPIKETPVLTGADADRFLERMRRVESMSKEQRAENGRRLKEAAEDAKKTITVCI